MMWRVTGDMAVRPLNVEESVHDSKDGSEPAATDLDALRWCKSSFSDAFSCVGLANYQGGVAMRNTNRPAAGTLFLSRDQFADLIAGVKAGEFDDLA